MFIDIHVHAIQEETMPRPDNGSQPISTPEVLIRRYDELGIEKGVILPIATPDSTYIIQSNEEVLRMAANHPGRFIPFCNLDPRCCMNDWQAPLEKLLMYYRDKGCKGVGEITANLPVLDPRVQNLFRAAEKAGLPVTFHLAPYQGCIYGLVDDPGLPQLEESLRRYPNLKFFGHSQAFWAEMGKDPSIQDRLGYPKGEITQEGRVPQLMRKYGNLYGDLSAGSGFNALSRDRKYAVQFLNEFADRLFFGTDICAPETPAWLVDFLLDLRKTGEISETVFQKVARKNAIRILSLEQ
ncbi:MAG: amidohydrolase [Lentisphaeria bacterium]|nr:amidohydrolase [Lentisphaeria bacterium]